MEAIKLLKEYPSIDLVLLDIKMPVMDGYETIKRIREIFPELPVIAQTAHAFSDDKEKILAAGFNAYLSKPLKADVLASVINPFLSTK
jgi:CheY-like chemotaxis protein